jgi:chorismate mutase
MTAVDPFDIDLTPTDAFGDHRARIDRLDRVIVALLAERMRLGLALGELKRTFGLPVRCSLREQDVLERVRGAAGGWLSPDAAERIFSAVIAETRAIQEEQG